MRRILAATALAGLMAVPAMPARAAHDMTCHPPPPPRQSDVFVADSFSFGMEPAVTGLAASAVVVVDLALAGVSAPASACAETGDGRVQGSVVIARPWGR